MRIQLTRGWRAAPVVLLVVGAVMFGITGCSTISPSGSGTASKPAVDTSALTAGYAGVFTAPPTSGPAAVKGKKIWFISCGQAFAACAEQAAGFAEAGQALGWDVTTVDGKNDSNTAANAIKQGVAAHVDAIAVAYYDCPTIKSALLQAKSAGVPVVAFGSMDCDDPSFGGGSKLFTASETIEGSDNQGVWLTNFGVARAKYVAAAIGPKGGQVLNIHETSQRGQQYNNEGFIKELPKACPNCDLVDVPFNFSQVPTTSSAIFKAAFLSNPKAKVISWSVDALMGLGLSTTLKQSGGTSALKVGAEGIPPNIDLIRSGEQDAATYIPYTWYAYGLADDVNRLLSGVSASDLPNEGGGYIYVDKTHNLPASGSDVKLPVDFKSAYLKIWNK